MKFNDNAQTTKGQKMLLRRLAAYFEEGEQINWRGWELAKLMKSWEKLV